MTSAGASADSLGSWLLPPENDDGWLGDDEDLAAECDEPEPEQSAGRRRLRKRISQISRTKGEVSHGVQRARGLARLKY